MTITNGYVTQAQFLDHMGLSDTDSADAADRAINAACRGIDEYCHRRFYSDATVTAIAYKATTQNVLYVDDFSTTTGLIVKTDTGDNGTYDTTWTITTDYIVQPSSGWVGGRSGLPYFKIVAVGGRTFPTIGLRERVQVTAQYGWAAVPDEVVQATLLEAARIYRRKDSPDGIAGGYEFGPVRVSKIKDPDAKMLLDPFVRANAIVG